VNPRLIVIQVSHPSAREYHELNGRVAREVTVYGHSKVLSFIFIQLRTSHTRRHAWTLGALSTLMLHEHYLT